MVLVELVLVGQDLPLPVISLPMEAQALEAAAAMAQLEEMEVPLLLVEAVEAVLLR